MRKAAYISIIVLDSNLTTYVLKLIIVKKNYSVEFNLKRLEASHYI